MRRPHWTQKTHLFRADEYICSVCGTKSLKPYQICPACGSLMRKTKYEASWVDEMELMSAVFDDDW